MGALQLLQRRRLLDIDIKWPMVAKEDALVSGFEEFMGKILFLASIHLLSIHSRCPLSRDPYDILLSRLSTDFSRCLRISGKCLSSFALLI